MYCNEVQETLRVKPKGTSRLVSAVVWVTCVSVPSALCRGFCQRSWSLGPCIQGGSSSLGADWVLETVAVSLG